MTRREAIDFFNAVLGDENDGMPFDWKKNDEAAAALLGHSPVTTEDWDRIPEIVDAESVR